jgi:hypothetical protein
LYLRITQACEIRLALTFAASAIDLDSKFPSGFATAASMARWPWDK